jgi:hypothetical protein
MEKMTTFSLVGSSVYLDHWEDTWNDFNRAIRSREEFNATRWTWRLLVAGMGYLYVKTGLVNLNVHVYWRSWVPSFAVTLVALVVMSYYTTLRSPLMERWCCSPSVVDGTKTCRNDCLWPHFHDAAVAYFGVMILFHYLSACFRSPGVALSEDFRPTGDKVPKEESIKSKLKWTAVDSRGGCCCLNPMLNIDRETALVETYYFKVAGNAARRGWGIGERFPSTDESRCDKCNIQRPPRCHHCSICDRCILQFDHHCVWLNNCVGYNNYKNFLLTLFYLTVGCWYGIAMLFFPFYVPLKQQVNERGWRLLYENKTGFLDLPPLADILSGAVVGALDSAVVVRLVFPLLVAVGLIQTVFFSYHVLYVLSALTTLEYKILLEVQYDHICGSSTWARPLNPFDHGWLENLRTTLGRSPFLLLLPLPVDSIALNTSIQKKET